jgi:hypothetical protein
MKTLITILAVLSLTGCAGTRIHTSMMENGGALRVDKSDTSDYDYKITMRNSIDFGMDLDLKEDRDTQVKLLLSDGCKTITTVSETYFDQGKYPFGNRRGTYTIKVKCGV